MIHKTSIIDSKAKISISAKIGPYTIIGPNVEIEDEVAWIKRIEERIIHIFTSRSNLTKLKIKRNWDRKDWWINADEALEEAGQALEAAKQAALAAGGNKQKLAAAARPLEQAAEQFLKVAKQAAQATQNAQTPMEKQVAEAAQQDAEQAAQQAAEAAKTSAALVADMVPAWDRESYERRGSS